MTHGVGMKNRKLRHLKANICVLSCLLAAPAWADAGDPPGRVARVSYARGSVLLQPSGETEWTQASRNYVVTTGDRLYTDIDSRAELEVGLFVVRMWQTTDLTVTNLDDRVMQLGLGQGSIRITVFDLPPGNSVEIDTPNGALSVLQPGFYRVDCDANTGSTTVIVNSGSLEVSGGGVSQTVQAGQAVLLTGTQAIQISWMSLPGEDEFDQWCEERDRRIRSVKSSRYVNAYTPGIEDLDSYGRWEVVTDYGPVWYPADVPVGWVPYRFGRWLWVEPWGWTWVDDEDWGFCPFHYGRWVLIGAVWGWVPGPIAVLPVYAPAFVAFLDGAAFAVDIGIGVEAWFPLGFGEPFFPWYHHTRTYLLQVNITNVRNVTSITNILNVTNISNIQYAYKNVAVTAVPADVFRSGQPVAKRVVPVPPQKLARVPVVPHPNVPPAPTAVFGGRTPIKAPPLRATRVATPPATPVRRPPPPAPAAGRPPSPPPLTARTPAPLNAGRSTPPPSGPPISPPRPAPPHLFTRTPPPPANVPFTVRQPALSMHPGRPLEPQQRQNLWAGRPPGPMRDLEFPPHPPQWRPAPPPPAPARPPAKPTPPRP